MLAGPLANLRGLRYRRAEGKGLSFTLIILRGCAAAVAEHLRRRTGAGSQSWT